MVGLLQAFACLLFISSLEEIYSLPFEKDSSVSPTSHKFHVFIPHSASERYRRQEAGQGEGAGSGIQEFITTAIKDGIAASSAFTSPTMFIGGFSVMMQPMPNGTEFAGQLMQMAPNYLSMLPGIGRM